MAGSRDDDGLQVTNASFPEAYNHPTAPDVHPIPYDARTGAAPQHVSSGVMSFEHVNLLDQGVCNSSKSSSTEAAGKGQDGKQAQNEKKHGKRGHEGWLILALVAGIVLSVVATVTVGAVLGTKLTDCSSRSRQMSVGEENPTCTAPPASTTSTSDSPDPSATVGMGFDLGNFSLPAARTVVEIALDCPALTNQVYTSPVYGLGFACTCGADFTRGCDAEGGGMIRDIAQLTVYSLDECLDACAAFSGVGILSSTVMPEDLRCRAVTFSTRLKDKLTNSYGGVGNCWLKNASLAQGSTCFETEHVISAKLIDS